jgi:hypothetical protein
VPGDGGGQEKDPVLLQGWCCNTDKKTTVCFVFPTRDTVALFG